MLCEGDWLTEFEHAGLQIPIMVGGATTSEMHVALKIAPIYKGIVVWVKRFIVFFHD